ncbi:hypothetical protein [Clostridium tarantellae]|uniref:Lipoprotein n=1 Tax=Clostridium tarantellae TaxID=39493 RepID=A0A6I1MR88_9CLOT|nr:hypothetical protein [Clostridium tarantellae]MPQ45230.1 hypothetical protein [Clostridium tarantellae]
MKKLYLIFIALSLTILFLGCGNKNKERKYSSMSNRDAIASFGDDGRFGIFHAYVHNQDKIDLSDLKRSKVLDYITKYKEINPYVYTIGEKGYTKLNYNTNEFIQSDNLDKFSDEDKEIFNSLK